MSVKVRPFRRGGWEVDIRLRLPDGRPFRERKKMSVTAKSAAQRWGESRERELLIHGPPKFRRRYLHSKTSHRDSWTVTRARTDTRRVESQTRTRSCASISFRNAGGGSSIASAMKMSRG
jgi:hypothetical protein